MVVLWQLTGDGDDCPHNTRYWCRIWLCVRFAHIATAQSLVIGDGGAASCYYSVKHGDPGRATTIKTCKEALQDPNLSRKDEAATHVNLGILLMRTKNYVAARGQYEKALAMRSDLPEAHINYAANLIYLGDFTQAVKSATTSIELGTKKMPEALFNRAMAYDNLKNYDLAYADLKKALKLRPHWQPALSAIANYEVVPPTQQNG